MDKNPEPQKCRGKEKSIIPIIDLANLVWGCVNKHQILQNILNIEFTSIFFPRP